MSKNYYIDFDGSNIISRNYSVYSNVTFSICLTLDNIIHLKEYGMNIGRYVANRIYVPEEYAEEFCSEYNNKIDILICSEVESVYKHRDKLNQLNNKDICYLRKYISFLEKYIEDRLSSPLNSDCLCQPKYKP